jgi:hypothetical protein
MCVRRVLKDILNASMEELSYKIEALINLILLPVIIARKYINILTIQSKNIIKL